MKKRYLLPVLSAFFLLFISFSAVHAQGDSISGDTLCGSSSSTICNLTHVKVIVQKLLVVLASVGSAVLVVFALFRLLTAEIAARQGNPAARMQALKNIFNGLIGLLIIVGVFGGFYLLAIRLFGGQTWVTGFFQLISDAFVPHAYAADGRLLPNPLGAYNLFDLILAGLNLVVKFFIYPAIIALWVWAGFQFVYSQGNPDGLKKAKAWLLWSLLITVAMFTLQGFVLALRATMLDIAPQNPAIIQKPADTSSTPFSVTRDQNAPADGTAGSACTTASGAAGQLGTDGTCYSRSDSYANQPVTNCQYQTEGTPCTVSGRKGVCTLNKGTSSFDCFVTPAVTSCVGQNEGTPCTVSGRAGVCTLNQETSVFSCYAVPSQ